MLLEDIQKILPSLGRSVLGSFLRFFGSRGLGSVRVFKMFGLVSVRLVWDPKLSPIRFGFGFRLTRVKNLKKNEFLD